MSFRLASSTGACHFLAPASPAQSCLGGGRAKHADRRASPSEGGRSPPPSSEACVVPQILHAIGALPGELGLRAAEVTVGGGLPVNGPAQVEVLDDARRH